MEKVEYRTTLERVSRTFENESFDFSDALAREDLKSWDNLGHIRLGLHG